MPQRASLEEGDAVRPPPKNIPSRGVGLVELMVGVVIALAAIVGAYRVLIASEVTRRVAQSDADAQQTAQFALARLAFDVANAGAGLVTASALLEACPVTADMAAITRPVFVLITDGGAPDAPDSVVVRYAIAGGTAFPAYLASPAPSGAPFALRTTSGVAPGDHLIATDRRGACVHTTATTASTPAPGVLEVAHDIVAIDLPAGAAVVNLGPSPRVVATRFDIVGGVLRTTDLARGDAPNPLASNIVNLKLQYGLDTDGDGVLDTWSPAVAGPVGDWSPAAMLRAGAAALARIKALRVGIVVRGDYAERNAAQSFDWVLFDCDAADKGLCPGRLAGTIPARTAGGHRYRTYETVIPLRNLLWNRA